MEPDFSGDAVWRALQNTLDLARETLGHAQQAAAQNTDVSYAAAVAKTQAWVVDAEKELAAWEALLRERTATGSSPGESQETDAQQPEPCIRQLSLQIGPF